MKSFTERVKLDQEKHEGLHVFKLSKDMIELKREPIDLITMKNGITTFIRARGSGHGNLHEATRLRLRALGKQCGRNSIFPYLREMTKRELMLVLLTNLICFVAGWYAGAGI